MTYSEIFKEIYYNNKKFIRAYTTICLVFSIFAFGSGNLVFASQISAENIFDNGGSFGSMLMPIVQVVLGSIDAPSAAVILSACSFFFDIIPLGTSVGIESIEELSTLSFGLFDFNIVRVLSLAWFALEKLAKSNRVTYTTGLILENLSNKIGKVICAISPFLTFLSDFSPSTSVQAASIVSSEPGAIKYVLNALTCFVFLMSALVVYSLVRCLFFFINIMLLPICSLVPFSACSFGGIKIIGLIGLLCLAIMHHPYIFYAISILILFFAIKTFKKAYITIRYFKNIYVKPFFKRFFGYNSEIPLIAPKIPRKIKCYVNDSNADIIIPVYLVKRINGRKYTKRHDLWWFVSLNDKQFICKPRFGKNTCYSIELNNNIEEKMFIKKSIRFFEIFNLKGNEKDIGRAFRKVHKNIHVVFSKEYFYRFEKIKEITTFTDYTEYRNQMKQNIQLSRKEAREIRRQEKLEAKEERRIAKHRRVFCP